MSVFAGYSDKDGRSRKTLQRREANESSDPFRGFLAALVDITRQLIRQLIFTEFQQRIGVQPCEQIQQARHDARPPRLMTGAEPGAIVAVEVFMKENVIAPVRIL